MEALSTLLQAMNPAAGFQTAGPLRHVASSSTSAAPHATLRDPRRVAALHMADPDRTLEQDLKDGLITPEEYDELSGAMDQDEYEEVLAKEKEEEVMSEQAKKEMKKLTGKGGVEFAPWMKVDPEAIAKAKADRKERKKKLEEEKSSQTFSDKTLQMDTAAGEMGGLGAVGLEVKILSEDEIELRWATADEIGNKGFIVQRRPGGAQNFATIATWEKFAPLKSKGPQGGKYMYMDDSVAVGTWVYRIVDTDESGKQMAIYQRVVEIEPQSDAVQFYAFGAVIFALFVAFSIYGLVTDPIQ